MIHAWVCLLNVMTFIMCCSSCVYKRNLCSYVYLSPSFSLGVNRLLFFLSHFLISMFSYVYLHGLLCYFSAVKTTLVIYRSFFHFRTIARHPLQIFD
ncbi:hypothetical protein WN943_027349 [Citrus x changshan-huyou]